MIAFLLLIFALSMMYLFPWIDGGLFRIWLDAAVVAIH